MVWQRELSKLNKETVKLPYLLFHYRLTRHTTTGVASWTVIRKIPHSHINCVHPSIKDGIMVTENADEAI